MLWDVLDIKGTKVDEVELADSVFAAPLKTHVLHSVVKAYRSNRRQGTHATKSRSLISGSGRKPLKQKGSGRARQGTTRAPHMYHGAVAHGPQPRNYRQQVNKKTKQLSVKIALSDKVRHRRLVIVKELPFDSYSTKNAAAIIAQLTQRPPVLIVDDRGDDYLYRSVRNIHGAQVQSCGAVNAEHILAHKHLILSLPATIALQKRLMPGDTK